MDYKEIVLTKLENIRKTLTDFIDNTDFDDEKSFKRTNNYFDWVIKKTVIISDEDNISIPLAALPKKITDFYFNKLSIDGQELVLTFYNKIDNNYFLDETKEIDNDSIVNLVKLLLLKRGFVIWAEFGFNIGEEFGGKHPALILKQTGSSLIVVPLSSQEPDEIKEYHVKVEKVYNYMQKVRWANVHRICPLSILRVDFNSPIGNVKGQVLDDISNAIKDSGIR